MVRKFPPFRSEQKKRTSSGGSPQFPFHLPFNRNFRIFSLKQEKNQKEEDTAVLKRHLTRVNPLFVRHFTYQNKGNLFLFLILAVHF